jgi:phospholipid/cholesterol/gamma-HCH transport system ATP-binding protein
MPVLANAVSNPAANPPSMIAASANAEPGNAVIQISKLSTRFGDHVVHDDIDLRVNRAEIFAVIGGSGSGKSTLLREMILLHRPDAGAIRVLGVDLVNLADDDARAMELKQRWGVMFQHGGLFGALTVKENIGLPMREHTGLADGLIDEIADWKLDMAGLAADVGAKYPAELSGGMLKRASLARALALDPELLFLDEPTAGLDPVSAGGVDDLVKKLRDLFGLTIVMVTHDLDTLWQVADRVAVLADGKVQGVGSMQSLSQMDNAAVRQFFDGPRARTAQQQEALNEKHNTQPRATKPARKQPLKVDQRESTESESSSSKPK